MHFYIKKKFSLFQHTNDFPLYTEAIKFFNHSESMVRIAVRTLSLNVYRVDDKSMLQFIRNRTAAPYFSNLVWFIGNHVLELDSCIRNEAKWVRMEFGRSFVIFVKIRTTYYYLSPKIKYNLLIEKPLAYFCVFHIFPVNDWG